MPKVTALTLTFDGESWREAFPQLRHFPTWAPVNPRTYNITGYELKAGKHTLKIDKVADGLEIEGFALVTEPLDMEGEKRN